VRKVGREDRRNMGGRKDMGKIRSSYADKNRWTGLVVG
jgi:hypothetical protein